MKFKQFKEEVNQDSSLLKLKVKDLADLFEIEKYTAKYFKKRFKDELSYAIDMSAVEDSMIDRYNALSGVLKKLPQVGQSMIDYSKSENYNKDLLNSMKYGTDNLKPSQLNLVKQTDKKPIKSKFGDIIEVECTCPICKEDIILNCFNSEETIVECPNCYIELSLKDNILTRSTHKRPQKSDSEVLEYLMNEIKKLKK